MKTKAPFLLLLLVVQINCFSQVSFEEGYIIDESNNRIECFIKNKDWLNNPNEIEYKLSEMSEIITLDASLIREFGINEFSRYEKATVNIDRSSNVTDRLSNIKDPVFQEECLLLKVLIQGKASLYSYRDGNIIRYFFKTDTSDIQQLVYKKYLIRDDEETINNSQNQYSTSAGPLHGLIRENAFFKSQLFSYLACDDITFQDIVPVEYQEKDLSKLFIKYNRCVNSEFADLSKMNNRGALNFTITPGLNVNTFSMDNSSSYSISSVNPSLGIMSFSPSYNIRLAIEAEYILPFNRNKWALVVEPTYHSYNDELVLEVSTVSGGILFTQIEYRSIELPIGFRYYFFISDKSKIFLDALLLTDIDFNSSLKLIRSDNSLYNEFQIKSSVNNSLGIGYEFKDRYSIEIRYHTPRELLSSYISWYSEYRTYTVILGVKLF